MNATRGNGHLDSENPGIGQRIDDMGHTARQLVDDAKGTVTQIGETLDLHGRVERNPYGMVLAALGVGYVLGGGLFTPFTGRIVRLGLKLAALPIVKDELIGMAEAAVDGLAGRGRGASAGAPETPYDPQGGIR